MFGNDAKWRYKMHRRFGNTAFFRVARRITSSLFVVVCHYYSLVPIMGLQRQAYIYNKNLINLAKKRSALYYTWNRCCLGSDYSEWQKMHVRSHVNSLWETPFFCFPHSWVLNFFSSAQEFFAWTVSVFFDRKRLSHFTWETPFLPPTAFFIFPVRYVKTPNSFRTSASKLIPMVINISIWSFADFTYQHACLRSFALLCFHRLFHAWLAEGGSRHFTSSGCRFVWSRWQTSFDWSFLNKTWETPSFVFHIPECLTFFSWMLSVFFLFFLPHRETPFFHHPRRHDIAFRLLSVKFLKVFDFYSFIHLIIRPHFITIPTGIATTPETTVHTFHA